MVPLAAGDHDNGVVVSYLRGPNIVDNEITQSVNDCSPDCAHGTYSVTTYLFNPQLGKLTASGPTVQSPGA